MRWHVRHRLDKDLKSAEFIRALAHPHIAE
jgi:hypothetical protein